MARELCRLWTDWRGAAAMVSALSLAAINLGGPPFVAAAQAASKGPAQGKVEKVTIALPSDINTLDPHQSTTFPTDQSVISHLYSPLLIRGADMKYHGVLAESWEATSDTVWRFKLRKGVIFINGEKLDAAAVKWNVDRMLNPATKARIRPYFALIKEARVVNEVTVDIVTSAPFASLIPQLSWFFLLPPKWASENNPAAKALGSGPYTLKEWVKDDRITLEANLKYWGSPKPAFTSVTFRPIPEASSRIAALLAGDVDIITDIAPADFARINASGRATAAAIAGGRTAMVKINPRKKPLDDVRVRQALNYAVDKEALIKSLLGGLTTVSPGQILTPIYLGFNPALQAYPYNPAMAKKLLAEAGYPNGFDLEFDVPVGRYLLGEQISQAIAGQLAAVGIRAKISEMAFSAFMDKFVKAQNLAHLGYITYGAASLDADFIFTLFEPGNPYAYWDDAKFAELIRGARAVLNQDKRAELYKQATVVMRDQAPIIFLFPQPFAYAIRNNTVNWKARPDDFVRAMDMEPK